MKIAIIYERIYSYDGSRLTLGGIQTYLINLANIFLERGDEVKIYQKGTNCFVNVLEGVEVLGVSDEGDLPSYSKLLKHISDNNTLTEDDLIIWGTEAIAQKVTFCRSIAIQHGIAFDTYTESSKLIKFSNMLHLDMTFLYQIIRIRRALKDISTAPHIVCVDYNFPNWIRTFKPKNSDNNLTVIPNFTRIYPYEKIKSKLEKSKNKRKLRILFARRFFNIRGIEIMLLAAEKIVKKYGESVSITFAGEGPKEHSVNELCRLYPNHINMQKYSSKEALEFHYGYDIALVPSIASEGTSLSLLEAMSAGCYCIATATGGMSNIMIDGFNGAIIKPTAESLYSAICNAIEDDETRYVQALNAYNMVSASFSIEMWKKRWNMFIDSI
ncbi:glycosyltransferase family 4 protein [uncultured Pseudoalteromonas sp.]|uniref:glycosyltransferase family 4 protein n=1 Tax=uncultured Pseudoalteromonas sp. TaxID=114053 RepID=UPI002591A222|nr:glycosyltransferase family 4 protein [uncultured Pseudoalteromonas sp.]